MTEQQLFSSNNNNNNNNNSDFLTCQATIYITVPNKQSAKYFNFALLQTHLVK